MGYADAAYDAFCSAYAAYIAGILVNVVGFAGASECFLHFLSLSYLPLDGGHDAAEKKKRCTNANANVSGELPCHKAGRVVPIAATRIYEVAFFTGFGVSSIVYYVLNRLFPVVGAATAFEEIDVSEWMKAQVDA
ncbi:hypothetical protein J3R82DRAFT_7016 [Butyriboletus roseoflavus]|nr:hypothetical protein J3R82DRAFT_7016 [Butyriboletus roseoflavus]